MSANVKCALRCGFMYNIRAPGRHKLGELFTRCEARPHADHMHKTSIYQAVIGFTKASSRCDEASLKLPCNCSDCTYAVLDYHT